MATPVLVPDSDVRSLLAPLRPGSVVPFAELYLRYGKQRRERDQEVASRHALSRALVRVGCDRRRVRKCKGPRGKQVVREAICFVVPGAPMVTESDDQMVATLREMLGGQEHAMLENAKIWGAYNALKRREGWRNSLGQRQVAAWLTRNGFPAMTHGGQRGRKGHVGSPCRYVFSGQIDQVAFAPAR